MADKPQNLIENILDHARWAPSGDNTQPWRFEIVDAHHFIVHGYDTRDYCVYDLQGHASQLSIGILLESIAITATNFGYKAEFQVRKNSPETRPAIEVSLFQDKTISPDPLFPYLPVRSVQRRVLKMTQLTVEQKKSLQEAVGDAYSLGWFEGWQNRWQAALLMFKNGKLRLTLPEAFPTHSSVIEWNARFSNDRIPDQAIGVDVVTTRIMEWAMKSWSRAKFLNIYFAGTLLPRIEMDLLPALFCAGHFALIAKQKPQCVEDYFAAGRALQRFWLTATQLNLQLQPEMTPLIFSGYIKEKVVFTQEANLLVYAEKLSDRFTGMLGKEKAERTVFLGRIGQGKPAYARSLRLSLAQLGVDRTEKTAK
jgi:hypothetical protein